MYKHARKLHFLLIKSYSLLWRKDPQTSAVPCSRWIQVVYERSLKKLLFRYFLWCQKISLFYPWRDIGNSNTDEGHQGQNFENCLWRENYIASGVSGCLWWGRGWGRGVGIKTLYGGNTDFMNHHTKYKKTLKTGWCDILTHPVKYRRISCQLKHTCSVLSSRPKRSRFAVNY